MTNALVPHGGAGLARLPLSHGYIHISEDDYKAMLRVTDNPGHRLLLRILWTLGLRISEVLAIRRDDIDIENGVLSVKRLKKRTGSGLDEIPLPDELLGELRAAARGKRGHERLIPMTRQVAGRTVRRIGERAGVSPRGGDPEKRRRRRGVHPHAFRHGRTYDLLMKGTPVVLVARILGHADLGTLMSYFHAQPQDIRRALEQ